MMKKWSIIEHSVYLLGGLLFCQSTKYPYAENNTYLQF